MAERVRDACSGTHAMRSDENVCARHHAKLLRKLPPIERLDAHLRMPPKVCAQHIRNCPFVDETSRRWPAENRHAQRHAAAELVESLVVDGSQARAHLGGGV